MDAFASWCGPCKWMSATIFTNDTVADFYNKNFICAKYDMETGEGVMLREKFQVKAYPSLLFISPDGDLIHKKVGAPQSVSDFISLGQKAMKPDECYSAYIKRYNQGENSPEFILGYLRVLTDAYMPVDEPLKKYFATQQDDQLTGKMNGQILYTFCNDMNSSEFKYLVSHQDEFGRIHGKDSVNNKIFNVFFSALVQYSRSMSMTEAGYNQLKQDVLSSGFRGAEKVVFVADLNLCQMHGDKDKFMELAFRDLDKYYNDDYGMLNNVAWIVHSLSKDRKYLEKAEKWSKRSVELKSETSNNTTYAALLYDLGKKEEAVKYCRIALAIARKQNLPTLDIENDLKKYEEGK
jgi:thiol-disulfide isomerase/thioredoxin